MKKFFTLVCASIFCFSLTASAQDGSAMDEVKLIQSIFGKGKKEMVKQIMADLPAEKAAKFWEVYDKYDADRQALVRKHLVALAKITVKAEALNDATAAAYGKERGCYEVKMAKLHKKYFCKMNSAVGGFQALKFTQVESYIENLVQIELQSRMPFLGDIQTLLPKD